MTRSFNTVARVFMSFLLAGFVGALVYPFMSARTQSQAVQSNTIN